MANSTLGVLRFTWGDANKGIDLAAARNEEGGDIYTPFGFLREDPDFPLYAELREVLEKQGANISTLKRVFVPGEKILQQAQAQQGEQA